MALQTRARKIQIEFFKDENNLDWQVFRVT